MLDAGLAIRNGIERLFAKPVICDLERLADQKLVGASHERRGFGGPDRLGIADARDRLVCGRGRGLGEYRGGAEDSG